MAKLSQAKTPNLGLTIFCVFERRHPAVQCLPYEIRTNQPGQGPDLLKKFFKLKRNQCDQSVATNGQAWLHPHGLKQLQVKYTLNQSLAR